MFEISSIRYHLELSEQRINTNSDLEIIGRGNMLLDLAVGNPLFALPLILIGICLILYGKEILEVLSFPIGAISGGILAYMVLRGFLALYEIPLMVEVIVAGTLVLIGGIMGPGTMIMVVAVIISLVSIDVLYVFVGEHWLIWVAGFVIFAVILYPVQKFLPFFSSMIGGILVAISVFIVVDGADPVLQTGVQLAIITIFTVAGGLFQTWLKKKLDSDREEILWIPTPRS